MKKIVLLLWIAAVLTLLPASYTYASVNETSSATEEGVTNGKFGFCVKDDKTVEITSYHGQSENLIIPDTIDGKIVTSIKEEAFYMNDFKTVSIPGSISLIDKCAF